MPTLHFQRSPGATQPEDETDMREKDYPPDPHATATDHSESRFLKNYAVPSLVFLLIVVSGVAYNQMLNRLDTLAQNDSKRADDVAQIKSDVRDLNTKLDAGPLRQIETNTQNIADHEQRLQRLERAVHVP